MLECANLLAEGFRLMPEKLRRPRLFQVVTDVTCTAALLVVFRTDHRAKPVATARLKEYAATVERLSGRRIA